MAVSVIHDYIFVSHSLTRTGPHDQLSRSRLF